MLAGTAHLKAGFFGPFKREAWRNRCLSCGELLEMTQKAGKKGTWPHSATAEGSALSSSCVHVHSTYVFMFKGVCVRWPKVNVGYLSQLLFHPIL